MYKNILIPVTFGEACDVTTAKAVAAKLSADGAKTTLLHAVEPMPSYVDAQIPAEIVQRHREEAEKQLASMAAEVPGAETALVDGAPGRNITHYAEENDVDLIVISSHRPVFSDIFLGSTAAWVVRHAQCPVHVIR